MRSLISFLFLFTALIVLSGQKANNKIKIVFRFDDYMMTQHIVFDSILDIFKKNHISLTLGVVPFDKEDVIFNKLSQDQLNDLKSRIKKNEIEIALHGFSHTDNKLTKRSLLKKEISSEFYNMEYNDQVAKIKKGKKALDSILNINTKVFIPPYNSYDENTIKALESLDFKVISASRDGYSGPGRISYIPYTTSDLTELPGLLRVKPDDDYSIIVVIHPYSFIGGIKTDLTKPVYFNKLDTLLNWINGQNNIVTVNFLTLARGENFNYKRFVLNSTDNNILIKFLDEFRILRYGVYNTAEYQRSHKRIFGVYNILFHIIVFLSVFFAAKIFRRLILSSAILKIIFILLFIIMVPGVLYKAINSHAFVIYIVFLLTILSAFSIGLIRGNHQTNQ